MFLYIFVITIYWFVKGVLGQNLMLFGGHGVKKFGNSCTSKLIYSKLLWHISFVFFCPRSGPMSFMMSFVLLYLYIFIKQILMDLLLACHIFISLMLSSRSQDPLMATRQRWCYQSSRLISGKYWQYWQLRQTPINTPPLIPPPPYYLNIVFFLFFILAFVSASDKVDRDLSNLTLFWKATLPTKLSHQASLVNSCQPSFFTRTCELICIDTKR